MERVLFPIELAALTLGVGITLVLVLSYLRSGRMFLLDLALAECGGGLMLIGNSVAAYGRIAGGVLGRAETPLMVLLTAGACGLFACSVPAFAHRLTGSRIRGRALGLLLLAALGYAVAGALFALWGRAMAPVIMLDALQVYATVVFVVNRSRIVEPERRFLVAPLLYVICGSLVLQLAAHWALPAMGVPPGSGDAVIVPMALYLAITGVLVRYAVKVLFLPSAAAELTVRKLFAARYGISPREAEIIQMILLGHTNRDIGARLFISDRTVKNHIYSIYRKTGASNKIQLLNLVARQPAPE